MRSSSIRVGGKLILEEMANGREVLSEVTRFIAAVLASGSNFVVITDMCMDGYCDKGAHSTAMGTFPDAGKAVVNTYLKDLAEENV